MNSTISSEEQNVGVLNIFLNILLDDKNRFYDLTKSEIDKSFLNCSMR